jgi:transcriptional regulator of heat shock response
LLDFRLLGFCIQKDTSTRVPTQITYRIFKEHFGRKRTEEGGGIIGLRLIPSQLHQALTTRRENRAGYP